MNDAVDYGLMLIIIGGMVVLLEIYIKLVFKYSFKMDNDYRIDNLLKKKRDNGKLNRWDSLDLSLSLFLKKRTLAKFGLILIVVGIFISIIK